MDTKDLLKENEELKSALKELTKEKNTLEYLYFKSFMKVLNAKKQKIKELEEQIKVLKTGNQCNAQKTILGKRVKHVGSDTSEDECSGTFYEKDTDVEDDEVDGKCLLKAVPQILENVSPVKRFLESSDSIGSKRDDNSETDLSQSQSQEDYSQCLLKPYSNSISSDESESETGVANNKINKKSCDVEVEGPSKEKRKKAEETTTHSSDLLEELLGDL